MDRLSPSTLKVLLAVISIHRRRPVTVRSICQELGWSSPNAPYKALRRLKAAGLIDWDCFIPHARSLCGTIRPTCTVTLFALTPTEEV